MVDERKVAILRITDVALDAARELLRREGFVELLPVIIAPVTDPLRHTIGRATIRAYDQEWYLTTSMIFHKQAAIQVLDKIFCLSPNIRLEPATWGGTGRHLFEFVQLDLEVRDATRDGMLALGERLLVHIVESVRGACSRELGTLGRELTELRAPFDRIPYRDAKARYGEGFEERLSREAEDPIWIVDFPAEVREFYDREDPSRPGVLLDMDLLYPEGYGEALSGGEREHEPGQIRDRIRRQGLDPAVYGSLLSVARPPSAGFGIGIERLVRFLGDLPHVREVRLFPRVPGEPAEM
ncbi:MAG: asparagine synthetase A [Candidatus Bipolaricaulota bacterium]